MSIIANLGKNITDYIANSLKNLTELLFVCPHCGRVMHYHGSYQRKLKDYQDKSPFPIHRLICKPCRRTYAVLPDFIQPYKQYSANEIESVLLEAAEKKASALDINSLASVATIRRWLCEYHPVLEEKASHLKALIFQRQHYVVSELSLTAGSLMENLQILLCHLPEIRHSNILGAVFMYCQTLVNST